MTLSVDVRNQAAWNLYRSAGFEAYDQRAVYLSILPNAEPRSRARGMTAFCAPSVPAEYQLVPSALFTGFPRCQPRENFSSTLLTAHKFTPRRAIGRNQENGVKGKTNFQWQPPNGLLKIPPLRVAPLTRVPS